MAPVRVVILGAGGLLGTSLDPLLAAHGMEVIAHSGRRGGTLSFDLTDTHTTHRELSRLAPDAIVNLVAVTNVDECENHPHQAYLGNVKPLEVVAAWIATSSPRCHLIQISTDQLYDGKGPHLEEAVTLSNTYAFSKYTAELAARAVSCTILRTNFFGPSRAPSRTSFSDWLVKSLMAQMPIKVFDDVLFSPLTLDTLASVIETVIRKRIEGVFNAGSRGGMSKADFAFRLAETVGLSTACLTRASRSAAGLAAYRPGDMTMNSSLFERTFQRELPTLDAEILSMRTAYAPAR